MGSHTLRVRRERLRVGCIPWLSRLPFVLVHVPVHDVPFTNLTSSLDYPREHRRDPRVLVYGNVNRFAVNVSVSRPIKP